MPEQTPRKATRSRKAKTEVQPTPVEEYMAKEPKQYQPPEHMVPLNDERYLKKDKIGKAKAVRGPGTPVTRVGLGGLKVIHQNPINYHGNIDVQSE